MGGAVVAVVDVGGVAVAAVVAVAAAAEAAGPEVVVTKGDSHFAEQCGPWTAAS